MLVAPLRAARAHQLPDVVHFLADASKPNTGTAFLALLMIVKEQNISSGFTKYQSDYPNSTFNKESQNLFYQSQYNEYTKNNAQHNTQLTPTTHNLQQPHATYNAPPSTRKANH